jgi:hypothetical protein
MEWDGSPWEVDFTGNHRLHDAYFPRMHVPVIGLPLGGTSPDGDSIGEKGKLRTYLQNASILQSLSYLHHLIWHARSNWNIRFNITP